MTTEVEKRIAVEKRIVLLIIKTAIELGCDVSLHDGETYPVKRSTNLRQILAATMSVDEECLTFIRDNKRLGSVMLVYGNDGWDVVNDHTDNEAIIAILAPAMVLSGKLEEASA